MLFENGSGVEVNLSLYSPPGDRARPVDAYVVTECEGGFTGSARRAAETVYHVLQAQGLVTDPVVVGYDLQGLPAGAPVTGESGGLAFAVALAKRMLGQDPGPVAATGEITSSHGDGGVGPVRGIAAKLAAAGRLAPGQSWVLYPDANEPDIPDDIRESLKQKGLRLRPVSSVSEALGLLFDFPGSSAAVAPAHREQKALRTGLLVAILVCAVALLLARIHGWPPFGRDLAVSGRIIPIGPVQAVTEGSDASATDAGETVPLIDPSKDANADRAIRLTGDPGMASELARLTMEQIEHLLLKGTDSDLTRIRGRIVILDILETPSGGRGEMSSLMTAAVRGLTVSSGKSFRASRRVRVTVRGKGRARELLPEAASALAVKIASRAPAETAGPERKASERGFD